MNFKRFLTEQIGYLRPIFFTFYIQYLIFEYSKKRLGFTDFTNPTCQATRFACNEYFYYKVQARNFNLGCGFEDMALRSGFEAWLRSLVLGRETIVSKMQ